VGEERKTGSRNRDNEEKVINVRQGRRRESRLKRLKVRPKQKKRGVGASTFIFIFVVVLVHQNFELRESWR
jgi:hypothetical protein